MASSSGFLSRLRVTLGKLANRWLAMAVPVGSNYPFDTEAKLLRSVALQSPIVIDVGANTGSYSELLEDIVGAENLFLFEPLPMLTEYLAGRFPGATTINAAASAQPGVAIIRVPRIDGEPSLTRATLNAHDEPGQTGFDELEIQTVTLDSMLDRFQVESIGLLKIDVEGHESAVLEGAGQLISTFRPLILVEIEARHHAEPVTSVFRQIEGLGYQGYFIDPSDFALRDLSEFDAERDQDVRRLEQRQLHLYLNNFIFVHSSGADKFTRDATRFLESERRLADTWPRNPSHYLARYWLRRRGKRQANQAGS